MGMKKFATHFFVSLIILPILPAYSSTPPQDTFLKPYTAVYSTIWKKGITLKVQGKQTLTKQANNTWHFAFTADNFFASLNEQSTFAVKNHQIIPLHYQYESSVVGKKRTAELTFDWANNQVRNNVKNKPWSLKIDPNTVDKLSVQLQLREDIKEGKKVLSYAIADGGYTKTWSFKRLNTEQIDTKLGKLNAVKVIRTDDDDPKKHTTFWFAPKYDYLLVKLLHTDDGDSYTLDIDSIETPAKS